MIHRVAILTVCLFAGAIVILPDVDAAIIRLKPRAEVTGGLVKLGDCAEILDSNPEVVQRLQNISLAPVPANGRQLKINYQSIKSRLQVQGFNTLDIDFSGSSSVLVVAAGSKQDKQFNPSQKTFRSLKPNQFQTQQVRGTISEAIQNYVSKMAPQLGEIDLQFKLPAAVVTTLSSFGELEIQVVRGRAPWNQKQLFELRLTDQQGVVRSLQVLCAISVRPYILIAKHGLQKGKVLQAADLEWKQVEQSVAGMKQADGLIGLETKRSLRRGEPVLLKDVKQIPLVRPNDIVAVYSHRPGITVKRHFKAKTEGTLGDVITLSSLDGTRKTILAKISGLHEAEVLGSIPLGSSPTVSRQQQFNPVPQFTSGNPGLQNRFPNIRREKFNAQ